MIGRHLGKMRSLKHIIIAQEAWKLDEMGPYERYLVSRRYLIKEAVMKPWIDKWVGSPAVEKFEMQIKAKKSVHDFPHRLLCLISRKAGCSAKDVEDSKKELGIEDYAEMKLFPKVDFERKGVLFIKSHLTQLSKVGLSIARPVSSLRGIGETYSVGRIRCPTNSLHCSSRPSAIQRSAPPHGVSIYNSLMRVEVHSAGSKGFYVSRSWYENVSHEAKN